MARPIISRDAAAVRGAIDHCGSAAEVVGRLPVSIALPLIGLMSVALWGLIAVAINGAL